MPGQPTHALNEVPHLNVSLRLATMEDSAFIFETRKDPRRNEFLGGEPRSLFEQEAWMEGYLSRHAAGQEYYFVISDAKSGAACGLLRLYNVQAGQCVWGSWVLIESRPSGAAIESAYLSFRFIFNSLRLASARLRVHKRNIRALRLYMLFGFSVSEDLPDEYEMVLDALTFFSQEAHWAKLLSGPGIN
ncbi:MAG: GNAT family N-acetyltransferase [Paracoccaceae bacterium]|jgi:RimJ/RimL family protein N-acetyltransferase